MRKVLALGMMVSILGACNPSNRNPGESGAVNDGIKAVDADGGLADTVNKTNGPKTDTAKMEDRVDISTRDTLKNK